MYCQARFIGLFIGMVISMTGPNYGSSAFCIRSAGSSTPIAGSTLCVGDNDTCIIADSAGIVPVGFLLADSAFITVKAEGYTDTCFLFDSTSVDTTPVVLYPVLPAIATEKVPEEPSVLQVKGEIVVAATRSTPAEKQYQLSQVTIAAHQLAAQAGSADDVSRYIGTLPSALSSLGEGYDNTFLVRGGRPDETIFMVDGIEFENINHFSRANGSGGPIGFVNTGCVDSINYFSGNVPAVYPARLSSVVAIGMKNPLEAEPSYSLGCKLTGGLFMMQRPLVPEKSALMLAMRYIDFSAFESREKNKGIPALGDFFGKGTVKFNDHASMNLTGIFSRNTYRFSYPVIMPDLDGSQFSNTQIERDTIVQGGAGATVQYAKGKVQHTLTGSMSFRNGTDALALASIEDTYFAEHYAKREIQAMENNRMQFVAGTHSLVQLTERQHISAGIRAAYTEQSFLYSDQSQYNGDCIYCRNDTPVTYTVARVPVTQSVEQQTTEEGAFVEHGYRRGLVKTSVGLRGDYFRLVEKAAWSPRVSVSLYPRNRGVFSISMGLSHQIPAELSSLIFNAHRGNQTVTGDSLSTMMNSLLKQADLLRCWQSTFGYFKTLGSVAEATFEVYHKYYDRDFISTGPYSQAIMDYSPARMISLAPQKGNRRSYGIEASLKSQSAGPFFYSLGMSLFDVKNRYHNGLWYDDWSNVTYSAALGTGVHFLQNHTLSFFLQSLGGRPYTPQKIELDCINRKNVRFNNDVPYFSARLERLLSTSFKYSFVKKIHTATVESLLEVLNMFNYTPTLDYKFNGDRLIKVKPFAITPIVGVKVTL